MTAAAPPASPPRSLLPQEHGAWGQLAMPLLTALLLASPTASALLLAAATVLGFLAHEPWLVWLGHRGVRAQAQDGARARRVMRRLLAAAGLAGAAGAWLAPWPARLALLLPGALAAAVIAFVLARRERTLPGELTVVSALASSGLAVALAAEVPLTAAALATLAWVLAFAASVFAVQVVLARALSKGADDRGGRNAALSGLLYLLGSAAAVALVPGAGWAVPAAVAPTALLSLAVCLGPFTARQLRQLGWSLVGATTATLVILVLLLRGG